MDLTKLTIDEYAGLAAIAQGASAGRYEARTTPEKEAEKLRIIHALVVASHSVKRSEFVARSEQCPALEFPEYLTMDNREEVAIYVSDYINSCCETE